MAAKKTGLSREMIIHPGETLKEVIDDRGITQKMLAARAGKTEQHISRIINGTADISPTFAQELEYVLGIEASFWLNLQSLYSAEILEYEKENSISEKEIGILKNLKEIIAHLQSRRVIETATQKPSLVIILRKFLGVSNLTLIPRLQTQACYRTARANLDVYVLFAWHKICDFAANQVVSEKPLDTALLAQRIPDIKELMLAGEPNKFIPKLRDIFASCGISFAVVPHFKGAPVQGFIKKRQSGGLSLCMTICGARADIFWFTLFHEIAHILNGDADSQFTDYIDEKSEIETHADEFAKNTLLPQDGYASLIRGRNLSLPAISRFAAGNSVPNYIVVGRLQKEGFVPRDKYQSQLINYKWAKTD